MSAADITALCTGIAGVVTAVTALFVAISHVLHHDGPESDEPAGGVDGQRPATRR